MDMVGSRSVEKLSSEYIRSCLFFSLGRSSTISAPRARANYCYTRVRTIITIMYLLQY